MNFTVMVYGNMERKDFDEESYNLNGELRMSTLGTLNEEELLVVLGKCMLSVVKNSETDLDLPGIIETIRG